MPVIFENGKKLADLHMLSTKITSPQLGFLNGLADHLAPSVFISQPG